MIEEPSAPEKRGIRRERTSEESAESTSPLPPEERRTFDIRQLSDEGVESSVINLLDEEDEKIGESEGSCESFRKDDQRDVRPNPRKRKPEKELKYEGHDIKRVKEFDTLGN